MDLEEQLRKARVFSDVSDADADTFAHRVLQDIRGSGSSRSPYHMKRSLRRWWGELAAAAAAVCLMFGGFSLYAVQHGLHLPFGTSAAANAPVQIGTAMVDPTDPGTFSRATLLSILAHLNQYNVTTKPQDHEVYVLTGGLGTANPQVDTWDSNGDIGIAAGGIFYDFTEQKQSPTLWRIYSQSNKGVMLVENSTSIVGRPVPWLKKETKSGQTYYKWDEMRGITQYYFKKGNTYVYLKVNSPFTQRLISLQGIMSHLVPIGNPVTK